MNVSYPKKAFDFISITTRTDKPRTKGLTMVLEKGLGLRAANELVLQSEYIDFVKFGWATPRLFSEEMMIKKIELYKQYGIAAGNGGTFLEIAHRQGKTAPFLDYCRRIGMEVIEVSNGVIQIGAPEKAHIIRTAHEMGFYVISEVGKKDPAEDRKLSIDDRINEARSDLDAGAHYVIIEAREGGKSLGVYDDMGGLKKDMAKKLVAEIGLGNIMFEAPDKSQQAGLILLFGSDVNLGNIKPDDVIPLETLRRGIRGDTCGKIQD